MIKKTIYTFILCLFCAPFLMGVTILPRSPSWGASFGAGMGAGINQGMMLAIMQKQAREAQFNRNYGKVLSILQGYSRENHDYFMNLLANDPDLSYSLKTGLIATYNIYRKARDTLDLEFNHRFEEIAQVISQEEGFELSELFELTLYMDPTISQKALNTKINNLFLSPDLENHILDFVKTYYSERNNLAKWYEEKERALCSID